MSNSDLPAGTVTFLLTEIEDSTRLWEKDPDAMRSAVSRLDEVSAQIVDRFGGVLPQDQGEGDSAVVVFVTASEAISCALDLQRAAHSERWPAASPLRVRMALHTGEVQLRGGNYYGSAINRCARLRAIAYGGQALLSQTTAELVRGMLPEEARLKDLGSHRLKDLTRPEQVFQLCHPDIPEDFPPLMSLGALPNNLPVQLTTFIGREQEMAEVQKLVGDSRLVTLTGAGGCGKTRLALQVSADLTEQFPDGIWFIDLAPVSEPDMVLGTVAQALGVRETSGSALGLAGGRTGDRELREPRDRGIAARLLDHIRSKAMLLILDNCEHLISACAGIAELLLRNCPNLRILATSREQLGIAGEVTRRVPSLALPEPAAWRSLEAVSACESVRLLADRVTARKRDFKVSEENAFTLAQICQRLDGIPLAIELAAPRFGILTPDDIARRLDDRFRLLTGGRAALERQQTLQAAVDWSYELLSDSEQRLLRRLSVFFGGFSLEAAEAVCSATGEGEDSILDLLYQLVTKSLVEVDDKGEVPRYRLLETIRKYGEVKLYESEEDSDLRSRHLDYYIEFAEKNGTVFDAPKASMLDLLETDHDNLRAALRWSISEDPEAALRLTVALVSFWFTRGHLSEARRWLETALDGSKDSPPMLRAWALGWAGGMAAYQGEYAAARPLYEESLSMAQQLGSEWGVATLLREMGRMALWQGDFASARKQLERSLSVARSSSDQWTVSESLGALGELTLEEGDFGGATPLLEESLALARETKVTGPEAVSLTALGRIALARGDYAAARLNFEQALAIWRSRGDRGGTAFSLRSLSEVALNLGDHSLALSMVEQSLEIHEQLGDKMRIASSLNNLGLVLLARGDLLTAGEVLGEALASERELGDKLQIAVSLHYLGKVSRELGDDERAVALNREALGLRAELGLKQRTPECLEALGGLAVAGDCERAARLFGAAASMREEVGMPIPALDLRRYERDLAEVRTVLGDETFDARWAEGRAARAQDSIAFALNTDAPIPSALGGIDSRDRRPSQQ